MELVDIKKWAPHIGMFMLEFGAVESFTLSLLKELTTDTIYEKSKDLPLAKKINLIIKLIDGSNEYSGLKEELIQCYKDINSLKKLRNIIAHNTIKLVFWTDIQPADAPYEEVLYCDKDESVITLKEIKNHNIQLSILVETLYLIESIKIGRQIKEDLQYFKTSGLRFTFRDGLQKD
ncbi:hypothetical protein [Cronobacter dublinensis]|uniref:hypothetical protein n=1 Tax=Cronobacter dublinensis TaxID=413497 RepID=UPI000CFF4C74|nr:hypothetical protein [Cronobacter dublinensis]